MALASYGKILRINDINRDNVGDIRKWVREHGKIGANGEGRVYGNGTYNLLLLHQADIVTEIEDEEICPGEDILDESLYSYSLSDWSPLQCSFESAFPNLDQAEETATDSSVAKIEKEQTDETQSDISNQDVSLDPTEEKHLPPTQYILQQEATPIPTQVTSSVPTTVRTTAQTVTSTTRVWTSVITTEPTTIGTTFSVTHSSMMIVLPKGETPSPSPMEDEGISEDTTTIKASTEAPTTTIRLIVGTPLPSQIHDTPAPLVDVVEYSLDDYDQTYAKDDESDTTLLPEAKKETLVQIKKSEAFWAFLSCAVLIIGLSLAVYQSQLCAKKRKGYIRNSENWSEEEGSMSVGTLVRNLRRKSSLTNIDETKYSLLQNAEDTL